MMDDPEAIKRQVAEQKKLETQNLEDAMLSINSRFKFA